MPSVWDSITLGAQDFLDLAASGIAVAGAAKTIFGGPKNRKDVVTAQRTMPKPMSSPRTFRPLTASQSGWLFVAGLGVVGLLLVVMRSRG